MNRVSIREVVVTLLRASEEKLIEIHKIFSYNNTNSVNRVGVNTLPILSTSFFGFKHSHSAVAKNKRE